MNEKWIEHCHDIDSMSGYKTQDDEDFLYFTGMFETCWFRYMESDYTEASRKHFGWS